MSQSEFFLQRNKNKSTVKETHTILFLSLCYIIKETGSLFLYSMKAYYIIRRERKERKEQ